MTVPRTPLPEGSVAAEVFRSLDRSASHQEPHQISFQLHLFSPRENIPGPDWSLAGHLMKGGVNMISAFAFKFGM